MTTTTAPAITTRIVNGRTYRLVVLPTEAPADKDVRPFARDEARHVHHPRHNIVADDALARDYV